MNVDLSLLDRWLTGWSLSRGLPLPTQEGGGLMVEVGWPDQLRRHVFVDAGRELCECAANIHDPFIYLKAAVDPDQMRSALPARWQIENPGYLMHRPTAMARSVTPPAGYFASVEVEQGTYVVRFADSTGQTAASGRVVMNRGTAVFDRIETLEPHRRKGLGAALMCALDALAEQAGVSERLLVATEAGRALYIRLGAGVGAIFDGGTSGIVDQLVAGTGSAAFAPLVMLSPSSRRSVQNASDDRIVTTDSATNALCNALVTITRLVCGTLPRNQPVTSDPVASPKLIDSCWNELDIVLAMLESAAPTSAYASVFMLENCSELKNPCIRPSVTITASGVPVFTTENSPIVMPMHTVLTISTWR